MIEFLELHACSVRIKGRHALNGARAAIATQNSSTVARQRTSVGFKLAVRADSGADGLVAPLLCAAYFCKLAKLFDCPCHSKRWPSLFVHVS